MREFTFHTMKSHAKLGKKELHRLINRATLPPSKQMPTNIYETEIEANGAELNSTIEKVEKIESIENVERKTADKSRYKPKPKSKQRQSHLI